MEVDTSGYHKEGQCFWLRLGPNPEKSQQEMCPLEPPLLAGTEDRTPGDRGLWFHLDGYSSSLLFVYVIFLITP